MKGRAREAEKLVPEATASTPSSVNTSMSKNSESSRKRRFEHIFLKKQMSKSKMRKLATDVMEVGWTSLYDENISEHAEHLRELAVDITMYFCAEIISRDVMIRIVDYIEPLYLTNEYHSFQHAVHVLCNCAFFLTQVGDTFNSLEQLTLLYAALIHDVGHLGVTNMALINKRHELAKRYNNQSVAEMNSLAIGLHILEDPQYDLLSKLSKEDQRKFQDFVIELVLATDIGDLYKKQLIYMKIKDLSNDGTGKLDVSTNAGRVALLGLILRTSDVGSSMQSLRTSHIWVRNYFMEVKLASLRGDGPKFDSDNFFDGQIKYIEGHSQVLIERLRSTGRIDQPFIDLITQNCENNIRDWIEHGREMISLWESDDAILASASEVVSDDR